MLMVMMQMMIFSNYVNTTTFKIVIISLISMIIAQVLKFLINFVITKEVNVEKLISTGGMPSSHSSFVAALVCSILFYEGADSVAFAVALVFALVTIHDSMGVRLEASKHAKILNKIINDLPADKKAHYGIVKDLKEPLGHVPAEVFAGVILGIIIALISFYIW